MSGSGKPQTGNLLSDSSDGFAVGVHHIVKTNLTIV